MEKQDVSQVAKKIRALMRERNYREVVKIAKNLNLNRINNGLLILDIVEAYEKLGDKKAAKMALLNYYDVHGITGRNMMQKLIELCIETRDIANAVGLCMEFENEWPESSISYLMRYQITTSAGGSLEERIYYLEKYKETEFEERWGYELAKLYDKNNQKDKCAEVCHEIICFFGTGKYVEKAVQLKERTTGLTEDEINIVEAAKQREEEERERREEEERLAREEMARLAEEEARRVREQEERKKREEEQRRQEAEYRLQESERRKQEAEYRLQREERYLRESEAEKEVFEDKAEEIYTGWTQEETEEEYAARRARQAEDEKIRQTEEAARLLREKKETERIVREQKIAEALKTTDRYARIEKNRNEGIYFDDIIRNPENVEEKQRKKKASPEGNGIFSSFGRMASNMRKTLQPDEDYLEEDDAGAEIEYITVGRESQAYMEDIEERMLSELDMLDDEQIEELTSTQIKELYELKILRNVRENIKDLIIDIDHVYQAETPREELENFVKNDPYDDLLNKKKKNNTMAETPEPEPESELNVESGEKEEESEEKEESEEPEKPEENERASEPEKLDSEPEKEPEKPEENERASEPEELDSEPEKEPEKPKENERASEPEELDSEPEKEPEKPEENEKVPESEKSDSEPEKPEENEKITESEESDSETEKEREEPEPEPELNSESENEPEKQEEQRNQKGKETILDRITDVDKNLSVKEFTECIVAYAETKGYQVEETAYMTIAVLAEEMQQKNTPLSLNNARIMTDDAMERIQKRNPLDKIRDHYSKKHAHLLKDKHFYWKI